MAKPKVATASLAGCFGCHMSILDIDERILQLVELVDIDKSPVKPDSVLIDAVRLELGVPVQAIIKGDQKSFTIAAASILAKVTRDRMMRKMHEEYPVYGWEQNKGYPTQAHKDAIRVHGFSPYHRRTFNSI